MCSVGLWFKSYYTHYTNYLYLWFSEKILQNLNFIIWYDFVCYEMDLIENNYGTCIILKEKTSRFCVYIVIYIYVHVYHIIIILVSSSIIIGKYKGFVNVFYKIIFGILTSDDYWVNELTNIFGTFMYHC